MIPEKKYEWKKNETQAGLRSHLQEANEDINFLQKRAVVEMAAAMSAPSFECLRNAR